MNNEIHSSGRHSIATRPRIAVADVKDYTGKFSQDDGGYKITQGAALMVMSALAKTGLVDIVERYDMTVTQTELGYANQKILGDDPRGNTSLQPSYRPIRPGSLVGSNYFIAGGVTEVNFNISSGGGQLYIAGSGGGIREYTMQIAVDLRLVNTQTLQVVRVVPLKKQVVGYEVEAGIFNFFGTTLVDTNAGLKTQEPLQLGVRETIEAAIALMVSDMYGVELSKCLRDGNTTGDVVRFAEQASYNTEAIALPDPAPVERPRRATSSRPPAAVQPTPTAAPAPQAGVNVAGGLKIN
jgi:curli production assembly/transport component CsgG/holdfast attachment protein HfaB